MERIKDEQTRGMRLLEYHCQMNSSKCTWYTESSAGAVISTEKRDYVSLVNAAAALGVYRINTNIKISPECS
jgi:hypothetical protein